VADTPETIEKKPSKALSVCIAVFFILAVIGLAYLFCRPMLEMAGDPEQFREYIWEKSPLSIVLFVFAIFMQVVSGVIPAGPFEVAAGYAFGVLWGTLIVDFAMTLGSVFVFAMVRKFGMRFASLFTSEEKMSSLKFLKYSPKRDLLAFLFFLIPGTPKDIFTYFMGFTDIKFIRWIFIAAVGRLPTILLTVLSGAAAGEQNYAEVAIAVGVMVAVFAAGSVFYGKWKKKNADEGDIKNHEG